MSRKTIQIKNQDGTFTTYTPSKSSSRDEKEAKNRGAHQRKKMILLAKIEEKKQDQEASSTASDEQIHALAEHLKRSQIECDKEKNNPNAFRQAISNFLRYAKQAYQITKDKSLGLLIRGLDQACHAGSKIAHSVKSLLEKISQIFTQAIRALHQYASTLKSRVAKRT